MLLNLGTVNIGKIILRDGSVTTFNHPMEFKNNGKEVNLPGTYNYNSMLNEGGAQLHFSGLLNYNQVMDILGDFYHDDQAWLTEHSDQSQTEQYRKIQSGK